MKRTLALAMGIVLATPVSGLSQQPETMILQSAERAALGMELQSDDSGRARSRRRVSAGVSMIAVGALLASVTRKRTSCINRSCTSETDKPLAYPGIAVVVSGVLLATVWSDVPVNPHIDLTVTPDRIQVGKTFGF